MSSSPLSKPDGVLLLKDILKISQSSSKPSCFSIVCSDKTLDLEADSDKEALKWVHALNSWLARFA
jgi:hypothetical protein